MTRDSAIRTLVLYAQYTDKLSYFDDWLDAFCFSPEFEVTKTNICDASNHAKLSRIIGDYDLIVLLHSTNGDTIDYIKPYQSILKQRKGKLLSFVGNELNIPTISMRARIEFLRDIEADFIGTPIPLEAGKWLYEECSSAQVVALPHALNPVAFHAIIPQQQRMIDIGVRTSRYLPFLGDNERNKLLSFFSNHTFTPPLVVDIDTTTRFKRSEWALYLNNCKGTVANEAGSYYLERDDRTVLAIRDFLRKREAKAGTIVVRTGSLPHRIWCLLPNDFRQSVKKVLKSNSLKTDQDVNEGSDFEEIYGRFFRHYERLPIYSKAISSRHFDAIGTKTCQILLKGRYNDILEEDRHYLALENDFSNIDDVMERFHDVDHRTMVIETAYSYVMEYHTYTHRINTVRAMLDSAKK